VHLVLIHLLRLKVGQQLVQLELVVAPERVLLAREQVQRRQRAVQQRALRRLLVLQQQLERLQVRVQQRVRLGVLPQLQVHWVFLLQHLQLVLPQQLLELLLEL
jgi:hypothetical protein